VQLVDNGGGGRSGATRNFMRAAGETAAWRSARVGDGMLNSAHLVDNGGSGRGDATSIFQDTVGVHVDPGS
jgi:hypothetical protein